MNTNIGGKKSKTWIWVILGIIVLVVLFYMIRGGNKGASNTNTERVGGNNLPTNNQQGVSDINSLDVGNNPDVGVDDFNSLQTSQEDISP